MLRHSYFSLFFGIFVVAIGSMISLTLIPTFAWADSQANTVTLTDKAKANIGLRVAEAKLRAIESTVHAHGNVIEHPRRKAIVTPRIGGIVTRIHSNVGEFVEKGDLLLELESLDLQMAQIEMIEAVAQKKSLESRLARLTEVFAKQIRRELQTRQIDYLQSFSELQELQTAIQKRKELAIRKVISALEQMRFRLVKADVELRLIETTLKRTEALAEKRISAQKELIAQEAAYRKGQNELAAAKRQFQILDVSEQTLEKILHDNGETTIVSLLSADELDAKALLEKYITLSGEGTALVAAEAAYKIAAIKVAANKQRALAAGLTEALLENLAKTKAVVPFTDLSTDELITNYLAFVESSEALEGVLQLEEALRNSSITLNKVHQKLRVSGLTLADIDKVVQMGHPSPIFHVTAPASGQIIEQYVSLGTTVEKSSMLFTILDTDIVRVEGEVHEDALIQLQDKWQIGSEVRIRVAAYPETVYTGRISHISSVMNTEERTIHFWVDVNNPKHKLKPGMFTEQAIVLKKGIEVLSVPLSAVIEDGGSWFVFVEEGDHYTKHEIVAGAKDDQYIEIREGIFQDERVVVQGTHQLMGASSASHQPIDPEAGHSH